MSQTKESIQGLYLEDLHVGQRFVSGSHHMDEAQIKAFAREFDPQPFHLDEAAAKASVFGGLAASGWHTAAVAMRLLVDGGLPLGNGIIGLGGDLAWPKPTRPGDFARRKRDPGNRAFAVQAEPGHREGAQHNIEPERRAGTFVHLKVPGIQTPAAVSVTISTLR